MALAIQHFSDREKIQGKAAPKVVAASPGIMVTQFVRNSCVSRSLKALNSRALPDGS